MPVVKFWNCVSWPSAGDRGCWRQGLTDPWPPARHWLSSLSQLRRSGGAPAGWCLATGGWSGDSSPYTSQSRHLQLGVESSRLGRPAERQTECKGLLLVHPTSKRKWPVDWLTPSRSQDNARSDSLSFLRKMGPTLLSWRWVTWSETGTRDAGLGVWGKEAQI